MSRNVAAGRAVEKAGNVRITPASRLPCRTYPFEREVFPGIVYLAALVVIGLNGCGDHSTHADRTPGRVTFDYRVVTRTTSLPIDVALADVNGDGIADLFVANNGSNNVSVFLGQLGRGFVPMPGAPFATDGDGLSRLVVADLDGDGVVDLATANHASDDVSVLLGRLEGSFARAPGSPYPPKTLPASFIEAGLDIGNLEHLLAPLTTAVGDLTGDGRPDVATTNELAREVSVLIRQPDDNLLPASGSPFELDSEPFSVIIADADGDARPDLATANPRSDDVSILLQQDDGSFVPSPGSPVKVGGARPIGSPYRT